MRGRARLFESGARNPGDGRWLTAPPMAEKAAVTPAEPSDPGLAKRNGNLHTKGGTSRSDADRQYRRVNHAEAIMHNMMPRLKI